MNYKSIGYAVSALNMFIGAAMFSAAVVSWVMKDPAMATVHIASAAAITCAFSLTGGFLLSRHKFVQEKKTEPRDGFAAVGLAWFVAVFFSAIPFFTVMNMTAADSIFEAASGLSTSGATVIAPQLRLRGDVLFDRMLEDVPYGILYWRSILNWLGGIGIVMFLMLLQPLLNFTDRGGQGLYNAEVPGLKSDTDKVTPRLASSARIIFLVYLMLTALAAGVYILGGMSVFDAVCHSFSTVSTGGFSTRQSSLAGFSPFIQWSAIVFMLISACNFTLTVKMFLTRRIWYFKDEEFKFFFMIAAVATLLVGIQLYLNLPEGIVMMDGTLAEHSWATVFRTAAFEVSSILTTTGFAVSDYNTWGIPAALAIFFLLMFPCGCGGSTAGGMKCVRILVVLKQMRAELLHCIFPRSLTAIRLNGIRLDNSLVNKTLAFMSQYLILFLTASIILPFLSPMDMTTAFSASLAALSNIGPGIGLVGPGESYAWLSPSAKYLLSFLMIAGRLEIYTCLLFFVPSFWKK